ncbi:acetyltransferase, including N-acetylases of ribosomal protein [Pseudomonas sp. M47T1]|uniref:GNAT family N-acetyltransferase n=1 Tax=Pseudomonas sp. M47T1 TaxID=1179778 RepID=UPI0002608412|nr:GNAT family N-acetyltransferase [Pseudomonas sp. M47T1]EIK93344.1 acetyltransferase, including N-acetylases of ribosomal protein [Pseudomonas sp. M47T1]
MRDYLIRELTRSDLEALLSFETLNRAWFEANIDARDASFYCEQGVSDHIEDLISRYAAGGWHPFVIVDGEGSIVGRANLKDIDQHLGCAEVGYRVAYAYAGQGIATQAVTHLIQAARQRWKLERLAAYVFPENIGSQKVLARCGFAPDPDRDGKSREHRFTLLL